MRINEADYEWAHPLNRRPETDRIVLRHAASTGNTAAQIHDFHRVRGWAGIAYHYYVRRDGSVWRGRPEWAVGGERADGPRALSICFEGDLSSEDMSPPQRAAARELLTDLLPRYPAARLDAKNIEKPQ